MCGKKPMSGDEEDVFSLGTQSVVHTLGHEHPLGSRTREPPCNFMHQGVLSPWPQHDSGLIAVWEAQFVGVQLSSKSGGQFWRLLRSPRLERRQSVKTFCKADVGCRPRATANWGVAMWSPYWMVLKQFPQSWAVLDSAREGPRLWKRRKTH